MSSVAVRFSLPETSALTRMHAIMKKYAIHFIIALLVGAFRAFVLMYLWDWFVTEVFHVSHISFLQVYGLSLVIQLFTGNSKDPERLQWNWLMKTLEYCVPEDRKDALKRALNDLESGMSLELAMMIFSEFLSTIGILVVGFVIHILVG